MYQKSCYGYFKAKKIKEYTILYSIQKSKEAEDKETYLETKIKWIGQSTELYG